LSGFADGIPASRPINLLEACDDAEGARVAAQQPTLGVARGGHANFYRQCSSAK
jgi:hypothetical protein